MKCPFHAGFPYMVGSALLIIVGIIVGTVSPPLSGQSDRFGEITCTALNVVDESGKVRVTLSADTGVVVFDDKGKVRFNSNSTQMVSLPNPLGGLLHEKPSDSEVSTLVKAMLISNGVPTSWIGSAVMKTEDVRITSLRIKEWGNFNKTQKFWPVRIRVDGRAEAFTVLGSAGMYHFDEIGEFQFFKDDYGKWKVRITRPR